MRLSLTAITLGAAIFAGGVTAGHAADTESAGAAPPPPDSVKQHWDVLNNACTECHNYMDWAGEVAFDTMRPEGIPENAAIWEAAIRKIEGGLMPPPGNPRPDDETLDGFVTSLENYLDSAAESHGPRPGHVVLHRLNRKEYANAVRDLLGVEIDPAEYLPPDTASDGFDNIANVLRVSPAFLDQYLAAARDISIRAVGDPDPTPGRAVYRAEPKDQSKHIDGMPLGTRGGVLVDHYFPADGEYEFNLSGLFNMRYVAGVYERHTLILAIDGRKVFEAELGGEGDLKAVFREQSIAAEQIRKRFQNIRADVSAGMHEVAATFVQRSMAESDDRLMPLKPTVWDPGGKTGNLDYMSRIGQLEIIGPHEPTGLSETATRQKIFICYPETEAEEWPCAERIFTNLARRAFRRPVTDDDMATLRSFYRVGKEEGGFDKGIQRGIMAILGTPKFLYRGARPPQDKEPGEVYELSDLELASRLSFFLWSSVPDDRLIDVALEEDLHDPEILAREVKRMLADPRAEALVTNFGFQWLHVNRLDNLEMRDAGKFPEFDMGLVNAFREEMRLFLGSIFRNDKSVTDVLDADYTFANERLADFYGLSGVNGDKFRRVDDIPSQRRGILGKGAALVVSSYPHRTSPVLRGEWVLETLIGAPPSAPPPGVNTDLEQGPAAESLTVRERLEQHRAEPSCNMCHGVMDPLGVALENFNAIGQWREKERYNDRTIDSLGKLATGATVSGPEELRETLVSKPERFVRAFTEKLMAYALGRTVEHHDMPIVRGIVRDAAAEDYRLSAIIMGIVESDPFQMEVVPEGGGLGGTQEAALQE